MPHPHYPGTWLDRKEASTMLQAAGLDSHITKKTCRTRGVEMTSDGQYVRKASLEYFIGWKVKDLQESGLLDPAPVEQVAKAPAYCTDRLPVCEIGVTIQREASRIYSLYLDAILQHLPAEAIAERKQSWELAGDFYDMHLQECRPAAALPELPPLTEEESANYRAYVAEREAEDARKRAMGLPVFGDVLDRVRNDDSVFSGAMGDGYLTYYDRSGSRPEMTAQAVYAYIMGSGEDGYSLEWKMGFCAGWFAALAESEPSFFWESSPPPVARTEKEAQ